MKNDILKGLISVANSLDSKGFGKEADQLDRIMRKIAQIDQGVLAEIRAENKKQTDQGNQPFTATEIAKRYFGGDLEKGLEAHQELNPPTEAGESFQRSMEDIIAEEESVTKETIDHVVSLEDAGGRSMSASQIAEIGFTPELAVEIYHALPAYKAKMLGSSEEPRGCMPNGKPLLRIPGDNTYGYQLTEDGTGFMAWTLKDCKPVANGRVFTDPKGLEKVKSLVPNATPDNASEPSQGPEVTDKTVEQIPVNPSSDAIAELQNLRGRVEAASETRRFEQDGPTVQEAQRLLGIKNITPLAPGVRRKYLLKLIDKGIAKLQGDSADDLFMSEAASRSSDRISKFASLLSGEFGGLDKKVRR